MSRYYTEKMERGEEGDDALGERNEAEDERSSGGGRRAREGKANEAVPVFDGPTTEIALVLAPDSSTHEQVHLILSVVYSIASVLAVATGNDGCVCSLDRLSTVFVGHINLR